MRFEQLKRQSNAIIRKKLYKSGKNWIVASMLSFAGGLILLGTSSINVQADVPANQDQTSVIKNQDNTVNNDQPTDNTENNPSTSVETNENMTKTISVNTNLSTLQISATGKPNSNINVATPTKDGYIADKSSITISIDSNGNFSTTDYITYKNMPQETQKAESTTINEDSTNNIPTDQTQADNTATVPDNNLESAPVVPTANDSLDEMPKELKNKLTQNNDEVTDSGYFGTTAYYYTKNQALYLNDGTFDTTAFSNFNKPIKSLSTFYSSKDIKLPTDLSNLFANRDLSDGFNLSYFDWSNVVSLNSMFANSKITNADFFYGDLPNVTDMSGMFEDCPQLTKVDFHNTNIPNARTMKNMFKNDYQLSSIQFDSVDSSMIEDISGMLFSDQAAKEVSLHGLYFGKTSLKDATDFSSANKPVDLSLDDWNLDSLTKADRAFTGIDFSSSDFKLPSMASLQSGNNTFDNPTISKSLDLSSDINGLLAKFNLFGSNVKNITNITIDNKTTLPKDAYGLNNVTFTTDKLYSINDGTPDNPKGEYTIDTKQFDLNKYYNAKTNIGNQTFVTNKPDSQNVTVPIYITSNLGTIKSEMIATGAIGSTRTIDSISLPEYTIEDGEPTTLTFAKDRATTGYITLIKNNQLDDYYKLYNITNNPIDTLEMGIPYTLKTNIGACTCYVPNKPGQDVLVLSPIFNERTHPDITEFPAHVNTDGTITIKNDDIPIYSPSPDNDDTTVTYNGTSQVILTTDNDGVSTVTFGPGQTSDRGFHYSMRPVSGAQILKAKDPSKKVYLTDLESEGSLSPILSYGSSDFPLANIIEFDTKGFTLEKAKTISNWFKGALIKNLDLSVFDNNPDVTYAVETFAYSNLETINLKDFDVSHILNMKNMFQYTHNLKSLDLSTWNMKSVNVTTGMFDNSAIDQITLGKNNKFIPGTTLPTNSDEMWVNIGSGTADKPEASIIIKPNDNLSNYYDGSGKTGKETFIKVPNSAMTSHSLKINTNLDKDITVTFSGLPNSDIKVNVPQKNGYITDKSFVSIHIDKNGTPTTSDKVFYNKLITPIANKEISVSLPGYLTGGLPVGNFNINFYPIVNSQVDDIQTLKNGGRITSDSVANIEQETNYGKIIFKSSMGDSNEEQSKDIYMQLDKDGLPEIVDYLGNKLTSLPAKIQDADINYTYVTNDTHETVKSGIESYLNHTKYFNAPSKIGYAARTIIKKLPNGASYIISLDSSIDDNNIYTSIDDIINQTVPMINIDSLKLTVTANIYINHNLIDNLKISKSIVDLFKDSDFTLKSNPLTSDTKLNYTDSNININQGNAVDILNLSLADLSNISKADLSSLQNNINLAKFFKDSSLVPFDADKLTNNTSDRFITLNLSYDSSKVSDVVADLSINSNLGVQVVKNVSGKVGESLKIAVPFIKNYHADKDWVNAKVNSDGTITTDESVFYTPIKSDNGNSNNSGSSSNNSNGFSVDNIEKINQTVATFPKEGNVSLYSLDKENGNLNTVQNRALKAGTDWFSDQFVNIKGLRYYRVATNEWVKAIQVYVYKTYKDTFTTDNQITYLVNSEDKDVANRALAPRTSWLVDRIGYLGDYTNPIKAYRVATNEFVKSSN